MKRKIFFSVLLLTALTSFKAEAQLVDSHPSENFKIGVAGYTYRKFSIKKTLKYLQSMGVEYLSVKDFWLPLKAHTGRIEAFKEKCASYGVNPYILGPISMKTKKDVDRAFAYAGRYGVKMFIGVPTYELLDYTVEKVKETGIKVAIHTHGPDNAPFPDIRTIVEKVKDPNLGIGCCMDLGHTVRMGYDVARDLVLYRDWIYDIHIKDETAPSKEGQTWEMGRGVIDFVPIVQALKMIDYQGVISLEFEKNDDNPHPGVAESIGYLRGVMDAVCR